VLKNIFNPNDPVRCEVYDTGTEWTFKIYNFGTYYVNFNTINYHIKNF